MDINIICVGKLKEDWLKAAEVNYITRINKYCKIKVVEVKDIPLNGVKSAGDIKRVVEAESAAAIEKCRGFIICCDKDGKRMDSHKFSNSLLDALHNRGGVSFIIGGSYGLSQNIKSAANLTVSFSDMTMPHMLFRIVLLEQIYRAFKINSGQTYHK